MRSIKATYNKTRFASKFEAELAKKFDELGIKWEYEPCRIPWQPAVRYYKPDFKVTLPSGEEFFVEAKDTLILLCEARWLRFVSNIQTWIYDSSSCLKTK